MLMKIGLTKVPETKNDRHMSVNGFPSEPGVLELIICFHISITGPPFRITK